MERTVYVVTEMAGPHVAGRPAAAGDELELTAGEALYEELAGTIRRKEPAHEEAPPPAPEDPSPAAPQVEDDSGGELQPAAGAVPAGDEGGAAGAGDGGDQPRVRRPVKRR